MSSRIRKQLAAAMDVQRFPVTSWMIAGAALCCLGINEIMFVRPMRQKLERSELEEAAVAAGAEPRVLDSVAVLMPDGRIVKK